ncbi:MAG TPA: hypothetical protein VIF62_22660 [Labilithrix sp.]
MGVEQGVLSNVALGVRALARITAARLARQTQIGALRMGRRAKVAGVVEPMGAPLRSPLRGRSVAFWHAQIRTGDTTVNFGGEAAVFASSTAPFWLTDATGARLRVDPDVVLARLRLVDLTENRTELDADAIDDLLERGGITVTSPLFFEAALEPGDGALLYGVIDETSRAVASGYRTTTERIPRMRGTAAEPLVVFARR